MAETGMRKKRGSWKQAAAAAGLCLLFAVILGILFDYWFDLNDDVLMKDILAGIYTGDPESRNIQMQYPVSLLISLFYRLFRHVSWYGLFLMACQFGSMAFVLYRAFSMRRPGAACLVFLFYLLFLPHLVILQYTVTTAFLCSAAAFGLITLDAEDLNGGTGEAFRCFAVPVLLLWLSFAIRSEMMLLMLPFSAGGLCAAILRAGVNKKSLAQAARFFAAVFAGILCIAGSNRLAEGSDGWQSFRSFFNARTELYDFYFYDMPEYEGNEAFYDSLGMGAARTQLLFNYNFALDESLDEEKMWQIAEYAADLHAAKVSKSGQLSDALRAYGRNVLHGTGDASDRFVRAGYLLCFLAALLHFWSKRGKDGAGILLSLAGFFLIRTGLWLFILYRGRSPERITHSLLLQEGILLAGLLFTAGIRERRLLAAGAAVWGLAALVCLPGIWTGVRAEQARRDQVNLAWENCRAYCDGQRDSFFIADVYSTVAYSEKVFTEHNRENRLSNLEMMGGWAAKSPLQKKKLARFSIDSIEEALPVRDDVFVICRPERDCAFISDYYAEKGRKVTVSECDRIGSDFVVYRAEGPEY